MTNHLSKLGPDEVREEVLRLLALAGDEGLTLNQINKGRQWSQV